MKDINLLQGYHKGKNQFDLKKSGQKAIISFAVVVVLLTGSYMGLRLVNQLYIQKAKDIQQEISSYSIVTDVKNAAAQKQKQIADIEELLSTASGTSFIKTNFLWALSSTLNENTFFTTIAINENGTMTISGKSATRLDITYFVYTLKSTELFSNVSFNMVNTESQNDTDADTYDFTITATIRGGVDGE